MKSKLPSLASHGLDPCMQKGHVLIHTQSLVLRRQRLEESVQKVRLESDVAVVSRNHQRAVRMCGPVLRLESGGAAMRLHTKEELCFLAPGAFWKKRQAAEV